MLQATPEMPAFCFQVLQQTLAKEKPSPPPSSIPNAKAPLFVCYKRLDGELRGCIGCFDPQPLHTQLAKYALIAALEDTRFEPIRQSEMPNLKCTVSLLHSFEKASAWNDWTPGTHGIEIDFEVDGARRHATFLPSVMKENHWNHAETLAHLVRKARYNGAVTPQLLQGINVTRYQDSEACISFEEAQKMQAGWAQQH